MAQAACELRPSALSPNGPTPLSGLLFRYGPVDSAAAKGYMRPRGPPARKAVSIVGTDPRAVSFHVARRQVVRLSAFLMELAKDRLTQYCQVRLPLFPCPSAVENGEVETYLHAEIGQPTHNLGRELWSSVTSLAHPEAVYLSTIPMSGKFEHLKSTGSKRLEQPLKVILGVFGNHCIRR